MLRPLVGLMLISLFGGVDNSQSVHSGALATQKRVTTHIFGPGRFARFKCDSNQNVFLRVYDGNSASPVLRISADGSKSTKFSIPEDSDTASARTQDFWVSQFGEVYVLVEQPPETGNIFVFDSDGKFKRKIQLDIPIRPHQIAVYPSGTLLVAGREPASADRRKIAANASPIVALFNNRGQLLKRIELKGEVKPNVKAPTEKPDLSYAEAVVASMAESDEEGNIYFVRRTSSGQVYRVKESGIAKSTVRLTAPEGASLSQVKIAKGMLAAEYLTRASDGQIESIITQVINTSSGEKVAQYTSEIPLGPDLACFGAPKSFTFVSNDGEGYLEMIQATGN